MRVGYARVSTTDQNLDRQIEALNGANVKKIFKEKISGRKFDRPELQNMLKYIRDEDEVVVVSLDRLGRNSKDLTYIIEEIRKKNAFLDILNLPSFDGVKDPNLKGLLTNLVLEIQKYTAEQEWSQTKERQRQGIKVAKLQGKYKGGSILYSSESKNPQRRIVYEQIVQDLQNNTAISTIAHRAGVSRSTVYRIKDRLSNGISMPE